MRLILPHLETTEPADLLDALRGTGPLPGAADADADRTTSLSASVAYSFNHLSGNARRLLPVLCLLQQAATVPILQVLSSAPGAPERFHGATFGDWLNVLDEAASVGLLIPAGNVIYPIYQIHPALPAYLAARWRQEEPAGYDAAREAASRAAARAYVGLCKWLRQEINEGDTGNAS